MQILLTSGARRIDFINFFHDAFREADIIGNIIVADPDDDAPSLQAADRSYVTPHQTDSNYSDAILQICKENKIDAIIPLNDWEVSKLSSREKDFEKLGVKLFMPTLEVVRKIRDKWNYREILGEMGIKAPRAFLNVEEAKQALSRGEVEFPLIVKPRNGSASVGVEIVYSIEELECAYKLVVVKVKHTPIAKDSLLNPEDNIMVEEVIEGEKFSLDVVNDLDGNFLTAFARKQLAMRGGDVDRAVTSHRDELLDMGRKIGIHLKHRGYLNTDVFFDGKDYYVIDINPRFGGGYVFTHHAGANIPAAFIALAAGQHIRESWIQCRDGMELSRYDVVQHIKKSHLHYVTDAGEQD